MCGDRIVVFQKPCPSLALLGHKTMSELSSLIRSTADITSRSLEVRV